MANPELLSYVEDLRRAGVRFVRFVWCDNGSMIRAKAVHFDALGSVLPAGVGISVAQQAIPATADAVAPGAGIGPVGEVRLVPDMSTLTLLPYAPHHARVLVDMFYEQRPWALCPRSFLKRMLGEAHQSRLGVRAAFENEFYLLQLGEHGPRPTDDTPFGSTYAMDRHRAVIEEMCDCLISQGIPVEQYYPESGPGQQEISVRYSGALQAADHQVVFRETVHAIAGVHGLIASFLPKVFPHHAGSGAHLHLSLWEESHNITSQGNDLSPQASAFIAGLLDHLPALMAITTPSPNSYRRLQPNCWAGAFRCWGFDNREAAVRVPTRDEAGPAHFELKTVDATSNPYLALGAVIAAGLDGVRRKLELPAPVQENPAHRTDVPRLPVSLEEALQALREDSVLTGALGESLSTAFMAVREAEIAALQSLDQEGEVRLLLSRY